MKYLSERIKIYPMKKLFSLFISLFIAASLLAQSDPIPERPSPPRLVNDFAGIMNAGEVSDLEQMLVNYNDTTSTQIAVVIIPDLAGYDVADFADRLGEKWGVGGKANDNGIVILVKPKMGTEKGYARVSVGYGLEDVIPDAIARRIVDNEMIPFFRNGDYAGGIKAAATVVMDLSSGKYKADEYKDKKSGWLGLLPLLLIFFALFFLKGSSNKYHTGGGSLPFWTTLFLLNSLGGRGHGGQWKDFSSGGGMFGGGGSGGFGGFGGGSFGGGGASGSW